MGNIFLDYTLFLAFRERLYFEGKNDISLIQLHNYRLKMLERLLTVINLDTDIQSPELDILLRGFLIVNKMDMPTERKYFDIFIESHKDIFDYEKGKIIVRDKTNYRNYISKFEDNNFVEMDFAFAALLNEAVVSIDVLSTINSDSLKYEIDKLLDVEDSIKRVYCYDDKASLINVIKTYNKFVKNKLNELIELEDDELNKYSRMMRAIEADTKESNCQIISDTIKNTKYYKSYYIYKDINKYIKAIFNSNDLAFVCLKDSLNDVWDYKYPDDKFDDTFECVYISDEYQVNKETTCLEMNLDKKRDDVVFYIKYIDMINKYGLSDNTFEEMKNIKGNLFYVLNSLGHDTVLDDTISEYISGVDLNDIDFDDKYKWSKLFLIDILEKNIDCDEFLFTKILFISNYYDITKDKRVLKIINKYKTSDIGNDVYNAIYNHDYSSFVEKNNKIKKK